MRYRTNSYNPKSKRPMLFVTNPFSNRTKATNAQRVVMFHIGRSGSTVVARMMSNRRDVQWDGEIYESEFQKTERQFPHGKSEFKFNPLKLVEQRLRSSSRYSHYGFEVKFFHLQLANIPLNTYISGLKDLGFTFICLRRKNLIRKVVSSLVAHRFGVWHLRAGENANLRPIYINIGRVEIDRTSKPLIELLSGFQSQWTSLATTLDGQRVLNLTYEDDIRDRPEAAYDQICRFIGIRSMGVPVELAKTNPFSLRDLIVNFSEVEAYLRDTPFQWMLYD